MDRFLIDYLSSGRAWVLVGSGPSNAMGYPPWNALALLALSEFKQERLGAPTKEIEKAIRNQDFPMVFELIAADLGLSRLLQILQTKMVANAPTDIYKYICRWPVDVYLTTNYDDEIQKALSAHGETFFPYNNSEDHFGHLVPGLKGAIYKLHGDLRSESGLILTHSQYNQIVHEEKWQYWRTKLTSTFQMNPIVVIGHSLRDSNIRHVLEAAKTGAGVSQPVCWIAPDVPNDDIRLYLEQFRIRVISYDNKDGDHRNLRLYLKRLSDFVPRRTSIHIKTESNRTDQPVNAGASGFFVYNRLQQVKDIDNIQVAVLIAAIQSSLAFLESKGSFTIEEALNAAGWPSGVSVPSLLKDTIEKGSLEQGLFSRLGSLFVLAPGAKPLAASNRAEYDHARQRFLSSLVRRIRTDFPSGTSPSPETIAQDICSALVGYFKESGLTLASILFASTNSRQRTPIPVSILEKINSTSSSYSDLRARQAFISESIAIFSDPTQADKEFLGRVAQGFFGFHALGAFGDAAKERIGIAKETVWVLDSNVQIAALALGSRVGEAWRECLQRMVSGGVRFFTVEQVFDETFYHFHFANSVVKRSGVQSYEITAAASGEPPFRKSNLFLQGFSRWVAAGNPLDWDAYLSSAFGTSNVDIRTVDDKLRSVGIEVVPFHDWPGFAPDDLVFREEIAGKIASMRLSKSQNDALDASDAYFDPRKKAVPEAESWIVVANERLGKYNMISEAADPSQAYFVSDTSILNLLEDKSRVTWQPEAFLRFASSLWGFENPPSVDAAFETIVWNLAQQGFSLLEERSVEALLGGIIDQSNLKLVEMKEQYNQTLAKKYGESIDSVVARLNPIDQPIAVIQLANEMRLHEEARRGFAEERAEVEKKRADAAESSLREVETFRRKMIMKQERGRTKARKNKARSKSKRKK